MDKKQLLYASKYGLVTFPTTHHALHAEKVLDESEFPFIVVPTPREISASCGLSVRFFDHRQQEVFETFRQNNISFSEFYLFENGKYQVTSPNNFK